MSQNKNINKIKNNIEGDGYCLIRGYLKENNSFNRLISDINLLLAKLTKVKQKSKNINFYDMPICRIYKKNNEISAYINEYLNALPSLSSFFSDDKILHLVSRILKSKKSDVVVNNQRLRVQIPGRDLVSNLPWHQDSHYNNLSNKGKSIVLWVSLGSINNEMGPIVIKKKSHHLHNLKKYFYKKPGGFKVPTVRLNKNENVFKENFHSTISGDIMLFDMNLVHRSGSNKSLNRIKWSAQARYHVLGKFK